MRAQSKVISYTKRATYSGSFLASLQSSVRRSRSNCGFLSPFGGLARPNPLIYSSGCRVMNVAQLLHKFAFAPHVEVVNNVLAKVNPPLAGRGCVPPTASATAASATRRLGRFVD